MRREFIVISLFSVAFTIFLCFYSQWFLILLLFLLFISLLGLIDMMQNKHTIRKNFPVLGRFRYIMEDLRPKIYQYFVESDTNGAPFNRLQRNVIYQRAKKVNDTVPFGTQLNVYEPGYEWLNHSINALDAHSLDENPRIKVGGPQCLQPYMASMYNVSAMSFGSLSRNAILALNTGAKAGSFSHNTGEGGLTPYHLEPGGDIVWNIGTGYFSCRNEDGSFSEKAFQERAILPAVKMIEIKFSQGAKPGHGGILPKAKVTAEIAKIRLVKMGQDIISPPHHSAFSSPLEFTYFVKKLRDLSGGKPIGFKLSIGNKSEFLSICKAMVETGIFVDFVTVDGGEGGTGAAPMEFTNHVGMPLRDAIAFVYDALVGFDLKQHIKIICSGKIITGFDIIKALSIGADMCNSARGMMIALGCIQALECNINTCPTGIATQNKELMDGLVVKDKAARVASFHQTTVKAAVELMAAAGVTHPDFVNRDFVFRRVNATQIETYVETYPELINGAFLKGISTKYDADLKKIDLDKF